MSVGRVTQQLAEVIHQADVAARLTRVVAEVIVPRISPSPTTPTGAGVTRVVAESIIAGASGAAVSKMLAEVILVDTTTAGGVETGPQTPTRGYGFAA